jgi:hypothetical protein
VSADFQFYPTKAVKVNKDRAAAGIFNMVDNVTGKWAVKWGFLKSAVWLLASGFSDRGQS